MDLQFWASTDVGRVRDHNEDNFLVDKRLQLFVVCDGMGGHAAGEIASAISVRVVRDVMSEHPEVFERLEEDPENLPNRKAVLNLVEHAIQEACRRVWASAQEDPARRGMGTTCSLLLLTDGRGFIGHVGDSRIYLRRQDQVHQITEDHSLINEMIRQGKVKKGEDVNIPNKNAVTRAVGVNEFVEVDTFELDVFGGDEFLLCSDGLSGYFTDDNQILGLLEAEDVQEATEGCIEFARRGGGKDNITAIVVQVAGSELEDRDIQRTIDVMRETTYFQYLSYKEMVRIVNLSRRVEVPAGEVMIEEGADSGAMHLILQGEVAVSRGDETLQRLVTGDHFGETALIDEEPQPVTITTVDDTVTLAISRARFMELLRQERNLAVKLLWNFVQTFALRMRSVPIEHLFKDDRGDVVGEPTPPSGTLVFEQDRRDRGKYRDGEGAAAVSAEEAPEVASSGDVASGDGEGKREEVAPRSPGAAASEPETDDEIDELAWEDPALAEGIFEESEEDMRATVRMNRDDDTASDSVPLPPEDTRPQSDVSEETQEAEPPPVPPARSVGAETSGTDRSMGTPISGESTVRDHLPKAQVLRRTKLMIGGEDESETVSPDEETEEALSLRERLQKKRERQRERQKKRQKKNDDQASETSDGTSTSDDEEESAAKRDPTMEIDVTDDNVEEIT